MPAFPKIPLRSTLAILTAAALLAACSGQNSDATGASSGNPDDSTLPGTDPGTVVAPPASQPAGTASAIKYSRAQGQWSAPLPLPLIPAAIANLPDGRLLAWSAAEQYSAVPDLGKTWTVIIDPKNQTASDRLVVETGHDMFCPGITNLPDGRLLVTGGISSKKTSIYDWRSNTWSKGAEMAIGRGYQGNLLLGDGSVFTIGGSFNETLGLDKTFVGHKDGEVWTAANGWRRLTGVPIAPFIGADPDGEWRGDNHPWLFTAADGRIFHAGPSQAMHWVSVAGNGSVTDAGMRGDAPYSINGNAVMIDVDRILTIGGAPGYENQPAHPNVWDIALGSGKAVVKRLAPMAYARAMHNSIVLPNGEVLVVGGTTRSALYRDDNAVLVPELWNPVTGTFRTLAPMKVPRTYHSVAMLLADGRVVSGGGGLCGGCAADHPDVEVFTPPYLLKDDNTPAERPVIATAPESATWGATLTVRTAAPVSGFALMRMSSTTHALNNDQRRIDLGAGAAGGTAGSVTLTLPTQRGAMPPGYYWLFAIGTNGAPSVGHMIRIG